MIKKIFLTAILSLLINISVQATEVKNIPYKNIKEGNAISVTENGSWIYTNKKSENCYIKKISEGTGNFSEFYSKNGEFLFSTGCNYEFITDNQLIGYSDSDLKFYRFELQDGILHSEEMTIEEISALFQDFKIINISDFSSTTNSYKIKKTKRTLKLILNNDTDEYFYHYQFKSNNAKFELYPIKGMINITKKGMIQFSHIGDSNKNSHWYIILVR